MGRVRGRVREEGKGVEGEGVRGRGVEEGVRGGYRVVTDLVHSPTTSLPPPPAHYPHPTPDVPPRHWF